jgi:hypothetical protein
MNRTWLRRIAAFGLVAALAWGSATFAEDAVQESDVMAAMTARVTRKLAVRSDQMPITSEVELSKAAGTVRLEPNPSPDLLGNQRKVSLKVSRKAVYGVALGLTGLFAGTYIGAALDQNCRCDDPGLAGAMYGAPIGAIAGAIFGVWLGGR